MRGLEENVQGHTRFVAFVFLENSGHDGARKAGLARYKGKSLIRQATGVWLFRSRTVADGLFSAANRDHMRGHGYADRRRKTVETISRYREPASSVKQITRIIAHISELEPRHRTLIDRLNLAFLFERQGGRGILGQAAGQRNANRGVLCDSLGGERLIVDVENFGDA